MLGDFAKEDASMQPDNEEMSSLSQALSIAFRSATGVVNLFDMVASRVCCLETLVAGCWLVGDSRVEETRGLFQRVGSRSLGIDD